MRKLILIFLILFGCGCLSMHAEGGKRRIVLNPSSPEVHRPTDLWGQSPLLYADYNADTLSISITDYWGDADVCIMSAFGHQVMDSDEATVISQVQWDFPLAGYTEGATYQIYIMLDNGEMYMGEFTME